MSSDAQRRADVVDMYSGPGWAAKVNKMSDAQVFAIWTKLQAKLSSQKETETDEPDPPLPF